jgi:hypothetical protein
MAPGHGRLSPMTQWRRPGRWTRDGDVVQRTDARICATTQELIMTAEPFSPMVVAARAVGQGACHTAQRRRSRRAVEERRRGRPAGFAPSERSKTSTGKFDSMPPSTNHAAPPLILSGHRDGWKENGIATDARTASTTRTSVGPSPKRLR